MSIRGQHLVCLLVLLFFATASQAYDVVLKNGKVVKGTLVSEDDGMIVIQDADGLRINIKRANVDADKTQTANPPAKPVPSTEAAKSEQAAPSNAPQKPAVRKPAKNVTEEDLEKLRDKYDLGQGTFSKETPAGSQGTENQTEAEKDDALSQANEGQWREESDRHRERIKQTEERYSRLANECEKLKEIAIQTHILVDQEGNELQMKETREKVCELADSARAKLEQERTNLSEFMSEAKEKAAPPGWLRDEEGEDPNE